MTIQEFPNEQLIARLLNKIGNNHIRRVLLLWMPDVESLLVLGNSAKHFCDGNNDEYDGDSWLAPAEAFDNYQIAAAESAGGRLIWGYEFDYPQRVVKPWDKKLDHWYGDWYGDAKRGIAYALWFDVAVIVCALAHNKNDQ